MAEKSNVKVLRRPKATSGSTHLEASELIFKIVAYVFVTIFALMCLYPLIYTLSVSLSATAPAAEGRIVFLPIGFQSKAFLEVIRNKTFWISYANTFFVTLYGTIYCMGLSILGAYALSKKRLWGHSLFNFLLIFTMWFAAGVIPTHLNYQSTWTIFHNIFKMSDQKWLIVIAMGMSAYNVILLRNAFDSVPKEIEEAATVDGATDTQIMSKIYVPMSKATVATVALFFGISRWNGYFWADKEVTNIYDRPLQVVIKQEIDSLNQTIADTGLNYMGLDHAPQSTIYAMIICAIIPIVIIYPFIQKYFAAGVNLGGVKE